MRLSSIGHAIVQVDDSVAEVLLIEELKGKPLVEGEGLLAASQGDWPEVQMALVY